MMALKLWQTCAESEKVLPNLDNNVKCNSYILEHSTLGV